MDAREVGRIRDQLRRVVLGGAWHGPALLELTADVDAGAAAARPVAGAHTIWEIVLHLETWMEVVRRRLGGEDVEPSAEEDWPPVPEATESEWRAALGRLERSHEALQRAIGQRDDGSLDDVVPGKPYDVYVILHGAIQHVTYHAGQIAVLKKAR